MTNESPVGALDRVLDAARKIEGGFGRYPDHLGACIGPLSRAECQCGLTDLRFAIRAYDATLQRRASALGAVPDA